MLLPSIARQGASFLRVQKVPGGRNGARAEGEEEKCCVALNELLGVHPAGSHLEEG